jgi:hypothetical protein
VAESAFYPLPCNSLLLLTNSAALIRFHAPRQLFVCYLLNGSAIWRESGRDVCESDCALNSLIYNPPTILMNTIIIPRAAQELLHAA